MRQARPLAYLASHPPRLQNNRGKLTAYFVLERAQHAEQSHRSFNTTAMASATKNDKHTAACSIFLSGGICDAPSRGLCGSVWTYIHGVIGRQTHCFPSLPPGFAACLNLCSVRFYRGPRPPIQWGRGLSRCVPSDMLRRIRIRSLGGSPGSPLGWINGCASQRLEERVRESHSRPSYLKTNSRRSLGSGLMDWDVGGPQEGAFNASGASLDAGRTLSGPCVDWSPTSNDFLPHRSFPLYGRGKVQR